MKLTVLVDNNTLIDRYFLGEPGLCYLIEDAGKKILFDTGYSDVFIRNAHKMKIKLTDIDTVVLSHGHSDHTGGLPHLMTMFTEEALENRPVPMPDLICHEHTFGTKVTSDGVDIGSPAREDKLDMHFKLRLTSDPFWITENLVYLGEIPRLNNFENQHPIGKDDFVQDDSALVWRSKKGLVIITGCSHAGICNIIERAKAVCGDERVRDIIGGFHLLHPSAEQLEGTVACLMKEKLENVYASHCTDLKSKIALAKHVNIKEVGVGLILNYREE
jgi:7,8-dihydropterin-6-yl-methyl-4-(beta-D-ribofuranosyl)aminobenzene 5'-phosphate synthase